MTGGSHEPVNAVAGGERAWPVPTRVGGRLGRVREHRARESLEQLTRTEMSRLSDDKLKDCTEARMR